MGWSPGAGPTSGDDTYTGDGAAETADGGAGTFDTVGSSLFMSSDQFEQYLALGRQALDEHFARFIAPTAAKPPGPERTRVGLSHRPYSRASGSTRRRHHPSLAQFTPAAAS